MLSIPDDDKHGFMTEILCMRTKQKKYIVFLPFWVEREKKSEGVSLQNLRIIEVVLVEMDSFASPYWGNSMPVMQAIFPNANYCLVASSACTFVNVLL